MASWEVRLLIGLADVFPSATRAIKSFVIFIAAVGRSDDSGLDNDLVACKMTYLHTAYNCNEHAPSHFSPAFNITNSVLAADEDHLLYFVQEVNN